MADYVEKWGDDVDSAVELALKELKVGRDEVVVEILEQPSKGFLGLFGSKLAKVKVSKKSNELKELANKEAAPKKEKKPAAPVEVKREEPKSAPADQKPAEAAPVKAEAPVVAEDAEEAPAARRERRYEDRGDRRRNRNGRDRNRKSAPKYNLMQTKFTITAEDTDATPAQDQPAVAFIQKISKDMGLNIDVVAHIKDDTLFLSLEGKDVGSMIGKRGATLDAVQYLASIVQNKNTENHVRVIINADKYREKREKTLQQLSRRLAEKCIRSGKNVRLEPMNPYERKVIHSSLQNHPKVTTRSEGIEPNRRVIIELKK